MTGRTFGSTGRFAPSPTGPLHAGSLAAALASWLDVRARGPHARWLVRIEDADTERCLPGMGEHIVRQLAACSLVPDEAPAWQTRRTTLYGTALDRLVAAHCAYPCACSRKDIETVLTRQGVAHSRDGERIYPGTCRCGLYGRPARAWRFAAVPLAHDGVETEAIEAAEATGVPTTVSWDDRRLGPQRQDVAAEVGDFVLRRADGPWAYQLAVVVDDADQGVTDVVRGEDLTDNTARQILLQRALGLPTPTYLHTPLVKAADGRKLSKQNGARPIDTDTPSSAFGALAAAATALGLAPAATGIAPDALNAPDLPGALADWVAQWRDLYNPRP